MCARGPGFRGGTSSRAKLATSRFSEARFAARNRTRMTRRERAWHVPEGATTLPRSAGANKMQEIDMMHSLPGNQLRLCGGAGLAQPLMALSGSPFDTLSHKDPSLESVGASLREQFVSTRRLCLLSDGFIAQLALIRLGPGAGRRGCHPASGDPAADRPAARVARGGLLPHGCVRLSRRRFCRAPLSVQLVHIRFSRCSPLPCAPPAAHRREPAPT